jgi:steroid delta-isomerase-like uncharacterized protein
MPQTGTDMTRAATDLIHAFNDADWDRLRTLVAPDLVYAESGTGRRIEGADAYIELVTAWKEAFPDSTGTIEAIATGDDTVAQRIVWEGTHSGVLVTAAGPIQPSGKRIRVDASAWFRFEDDTIREVHHHIDVLTMLQQIGAMTG